MAWETRERGGRYYTQSYRAGGKVRRRYIALSIAPLVAELDAERREEREAARRAWKKEREALEAEERALNEQGREVARITTETLQAAGYHRHKGQWRKRRGKEEERTRQAAVDGEGHRGRER